MSGGGVLGASSARLLVRVAIACGVLCVGAPFARAETMLVVEPSGSTVASAGAGRLVARFGDRVGATGWTVVRASAEQQGRGVALLGCDSPSCALAGLTALGVDVVVAPSVWQRVDGRRELAITVQGPSGRLLELVAPIDAARPLDAADVLAGRFLSEWPALRVVPAEAIAVDEPEAEAESTRGERSAWNVPLGTVLLVAAIAPTAIGAGTIARSGDCVVVDGQRACTVSSSGTVERYHAGVRTYALLGAGLATAGVGLYVLAAGPIRVRPTLDISSSAVTFGAAGTF